MKIELYMQKNLNRLKCIQGSLESDFYYYTRRRNQQKIMDTAEEIKKVKAAIKLKEQNK